MALAAGRAAERMNLDGGARPAMVGVDLGGWFAILPSLPLPGRGVFIEPERASAARIGPGEGDERWF